MTDTLALNRSIGVKGDFILSFCESWADWAACRVVQANVNNNDTLLEPPTHVLDPNISKLYDSVYWHPSFGKIYLLAPNSDSKDKPTNVARILHEMRAAKPFGPLYAGKVDLVAILETRMLELSYMALYHTGEGTYWAQNHLILPAGGKEGGRLVDTTKGVGLCQMKRLDPAHDMSTRSSTMPKDASTR